MSAVERDKDLWKFLVVAADSKLTIRDIKRLTKSKSLFQVKQLKANPNKDVAEMLNVIGMALDCIHIQGDFARKFKVYRVDPNAISTFYSVADPAFIAALELDPYQYAELAACIAVMVGVMAVWEKTDEMLEDFRRVYTEANTAMIELSVLKHEFQHLHLMRNKLGNTAFKDAMASVERLTKSKW